MIIEAYVYTSEADKIKAKRKKYIDKPFIKGKYANAAMSLRSRRTALFEITDGDPSSNLEAAACFLIKSTFPLGGRVEWIPGNKMLRITENID